MNNAMMMITEHEQVWRFSYLTPGSCFGAEICSMVTPLERLLLFCWLSSLARNPLRFFFSAVIVTPVAEGAPTMATAAAEDDDDDIVLLSAVVDSTRKDFS